jgi:hypothetical protein
VPWSKESREFMPEKGEDAVKSIFLSKGKISFMITSNREGTVGEK